MTTNESPAIYTITTTDIKRAAVWLAAGLLTHVSKQSCSPRCQVETADTPEAQQLLRNYELGLPLPVTHRDVMQAYTTLLSECKRLQPGRIGGVA